MRLNLARTICGKVMQSKMFASYLFPSVMFATAAILITDCPSAHGPCGRNMFMHPGTSYCCKGTSCAPGTVVEPCKGEGGQDTCRKCKPGTHMLDNNTSELLVDCIAFDCDPEKTVRAEQPATVNDPHACGLHCRCDLNQNFCGTNPCKCRKHHCEFGKELQQNCGCEPQKRRKKPVSPTPPDKTAKVPSTLPNEIDHGIDNSKEDLDKDRPKKDHDDKSKPRGDNEHKENTENGSGEMKVIKVILYLLLALFGAAFIIILLVIVVLCIYKRGGQTNNYYRADNATYGDNNAIHVPV